MTMTLERVREREAERSRTDNTEMCFLNEMFYGMLWRSNRDKVWRRLSVTSAPFSISGVLLQPLSFRNSQLFCSQC